MTSRKVLKITQHSISFRINLLLFFKYLIFFIWIHWVSAVACGIFIASYEIFLSWCTDSLVVVLGLSYSTECGHLVP